VNILDEYINRLNELGLSLMIYDRGKVIFRSASKGVRPHLEAIDALGARLKGTTMVDKIIGRAAALLIIYSGAADVHAGIISTGGRGLIEREGIKLSFNKETEHIKTVDGRIYCPFEAMVQGIDDPVEAYHAVVKKMNSFSTSTKCD
jgi:hypothetical protein